MFTGKRMTLVAGTILAITLVSVRSATSAEGRPGIALKLVPVGENARITIALDYLQSPTDKPKFKGVRFYTYDVRIGALPQRIGWVDKRPRGLLLFESPPTVLLNKARFAFTPASVDRQENGSVRVSRIGEEQFHIEGVYWYFGTLFIIDAKLKTEQPLLLFADP